MLDCIKIKRLTRTKKDVRHNEASKKKYKFKKQRVSHIKYL